MIETRCVPDSLRYFSRGHAGTQRNALPAGNSPDLPALGLTGAGSRGPPLTRGGGQAGAGAGAGVRVRPTKGDRCCAMLASSRRSDSISACGPSQSAVSGCG